MTDETLWWSKMAASVSPCTQNWWDIKCLEGAGAGKRFVQIFECYETPIQTWLIRWPHALGAQLKTRLLENHLRAGAFLVWVIDQGLVRAKVSFIAFITGYV